MLPLREQESAPRRTSLPLRTMHESIRVACPDACFRPGEASVFT